MRALLIAAFLASPALAVEPGEMLADPILESRAQEIGHQVRCVVCRSESVEESGAQVAAELRGVIRERVLAGDSDTEVMDYIAARYGDYIRLKPRFGGSTLWLWLAGPALLAVGAVVAASVIRRQKPAVAALSAEEEARLARLLKDGGTGGADTSRP